LYLDKSTVISAEGSAVSVSGYGDARIWSSFINGYYSGLEALGSAKIEASFVSVVALGPARECAINADVNLRRSIIYSEAGDPGNCGTGGSTEVWDMNWNPPNPDNWFADPLLGDLHVGQLDGITNLPEFTYDRRFGDPLCDIDGDPIPDFDAYPGADQPQ
jgi:hypothetical protein